MSEKPDDVDALLGQLGSADLPADERERLQARAQGSLQHHAAEAQGPLGKFWRVWGKWLEPVLVGIAVVGFVAWALLRVLGG